MNKGMKNITSFIVLILLTILIIVLPNFIKKENNVIDKNISNKTDKSVCKVRNIYYDSLQAAINNNPDNLVYELVDDVKETIKVVNRSLTIDGNNHKIYNNVLENNLSIIDVKNSTLNLKNIEICGNKKTKIGMYITSSNIELENVKIENFISDEEKFPNGCGVYLVNEKTKSILLRINNSFFKNCSSYSLFVDNKSENKDEIIPVIRIKIDNSFFVNDNDFVNIFIAMIGNIEGTINMNKFESMNKENYAIYQNTKYNKITYANNLFFNDFKCIFQQIKS